MTNRSYRVLYVENANSVGGSIISVYRLVQQLNRQHYEPIILFHRPNGYEPRFRALGIEVIVLDGKETPQAQAGSGHSRDIAAWLGHYSSTLAHTYRRLKSIYLLGSQTLPESRRIYRIIKDRRIDLVHLNNRLSSNRSGALAARWARTPCLCHVRDFDHLTWFDRWLVKRVDHFAFMSRALEQSLKAAEPSLRGSVVYDGLELDRFLTSQDKANFRQELGLSNDDFVVGNVGRLVPWKGQEVFLRALARVAPQIRNLKALIVGDPDPPAETAYLKHLQSLVQELGLSDIVRFTGFYSDIPRLMASLDVLVHSSSSPEPFGIVVIEGMAAGKPVIATRAGGVLDIIEDGDNGLLVPVGDDQSMAEAILTLARCPDLAARLGTNARQRVTACFTVTQYVQTVQTIYQSLLEER
ncbi:MAG: glycosyltransferase family 4 protein [Anaerolineae bacterium]|jgi:glycosyltransferase involved in cell wall biosynthesis|nr:glycosyltransferase family 4 protein [Anaerolineae bacterium]MDH7473675.1 glycosyltransferase family 4 protein [Anaerolineae bacterium]